jgi:hypothetical protein
MNISVTPDLEHVERDELQNMRIEIMDKFIHNGINKVKCGEYCNPDEVWAELDQIIDAEKNKYT